MLEKMLHYPESVRRRLAQITRQVERRKMDTLTGAREMLAVAPDMGAPILVTALALQGEGKVTQAEDTLWSGLRKAPCCGELYFGLGSLIRELRPEDPTASEMLMYGCRLLGMAGKIKSTVAELVGDVVRQFGPAGVPASYAAAAERYEAELKSAEGERDPRVLPFRAFHKLLEEAETAVQPATLQEIQQHQSDEPLLYAALRHWANESPEYGSLHLQAVQIFIALLGEMGGPERIADLLELSQSKERTTFLHVHWAIWRLGQRFPEEALKTFRETTRGASLGMRCALAEHLTLLPPDLEGMTEAFADLLNGFGRFAGADDTSYLLALTTNAMAERGAVDAAHALLELHRAALNRDGRKWLEAMLESDEALLTRLEEEEIPDFLIEEVVFERALMGEGKEEEEDAFEEDDDGEDKGEEGPTLPFRVLSGMGRWFSAGDRERANLMFYGSTQPKEIDPDEMDAMVQFLLHDFRDEASGKTLVEHYLEETRGELNDEERVLLESMRDARLGVYEIERIERGRGVSMRDVFDGQEFFVEDITTSRESVKGSLALVRVQLLGGRYILAGNGTGVAPESLDELKEFVRRESRKAGQTEAEFVRSNGHRIRREIAEWHRRRLAGLKVVDAVGDELEFCSARYEVLERSALLAALRLVGDLTEEEASGGKVRFTWLETGEGPRRVHGTIEITGKELKLDTTSRRLLELGRGLLEYNAGRLLKYLGEKSTTMEDIKRDILSGKAGPPRKERAPSPEEFAALLEFKKQHYAGWVDEKLPAFRGKSARQMMKTPAGRDEVVRLLRTMQRDEARKIGTGEPAYDFNILRRALGLEEE